MSAQIFPIPTSNTVARSDKNAEIKTLWTVLVLAFILAGAHAYLTARLTDLVMRAQTHAEKSEAPVLEKRTTMIDPADFEVKSAAEVEAINAGLYSHFESGN